MKKRSLAFSILVVFLVLGVSSVFAAPLNMSDSEKVNKAYSCLNEKITNATCQKLSLSEQIFSLLATGKCKEELKDAGSNNECWPTGKCDLINTAQAVLALSNSGENVDDAKEWLLNQKEVPNNLIWYLEIENEGNTTCKISYDNRNYEIKIGDDKLITGLSGSCLNGNGAYWLTVSPNCYEKEFEITCDKDFLTTFLFNQRNHETIHVIDKVHSAPAGGKTIEKIESYCFAKRGVCDYEGSLWATTVLDKLGEDVTSFIPYLITAADDNKDVFPYPFLYSLTNKVEYKTKVLSYQIDNKYWKQTNKDRYYDTAYALLPFQNEEIEEKTNSKTWLFDVQQESGCWDNGNIRNNGFILYSLWPKKFSNDGDEVEDYDNDCELSGYFCMSSISCDGNILYDYKCTGLSRCCDTEKVEQTCTELNGDICSSNEFCSLGETVYATGLKSYEVCCVGGTCLPKSTGDVVSDEDDCELNYGVCELSTCETGYSESSEFVCEDLTNICCVRDATSSSQKNYIWLWILFVLIILVVVGIIYRDKIKEFLNKGKKPEPKKPSDFPPYQRPPVMLQQRRIIPQPIERPPVRQMPMRPKPKSPKELDEVLKKLKEMSK